MKSKYIPAGSYISGHDNQARVYWSRCGMRCSGTPPLLFFRAEREKSLCADFRFVFCNDIHFGCGDDRELMAHAVETLKSEASTWDFIVCAGDLSCNGSIDEMESIKKELKRLKKPFYPIAGNHDVTGPGADGMANYAAVFGNNRDNYLIVHKGVGLLFLNAANGTQAHVEMPERTLDFYLRTLETLSSHLPLIIFTHFPLHPDTPRFAVKKTEPLFSLLDSRTVLAFFSGHFHSRWQGWRNGVPFYCNARLLPNIPNHDESGDAGYCIVEVFDSGVKVMYRNVDYQMSYQRMK